MPNSYSNKDFEDRFTKVNDAIRYIEELEKIDLAQFEDTMLCEMINDRFHIIPYTDAIIPAGSLLFRARTNINDHPYSRLSDIYVPPKSLINQYGRANRPNEQIFYCASNFRLASIEVIQNLKNSFSPQTEIAFLTIGVWKVKQDLHVASIIHSPILHKIRNDIASQYNEHQKRLNSGYINDEIVTASNLISQFFADQYTKEIIKSHHEYKFSGFYARTLHDMNKFIASGFQKERFDGVNYPSVAMKYKGDNQALFIESADTKLELINALDVVCSNINFDSGEFVAGIMHEAESVIDGDIKWKSEIYRPK